MSRDRSSRKARDRQPVEAEAARWRELYEALEEVKGTPHRGANVLSFYRDLMVASYERLLQLGMDVSDWRHPRVVPVPGTRHPKTGAEARRWEAELSFRTTQYAFSFSVTSAGAHVVYSAVGKEPLAEVMAGYVAGYPEVVTKDEIAAWVSSSNLDVLALACSLWLLEPTGEMRSSAADLDSACYERMLYAFELNPLVRINQTARDAKKAEAERTASSDAMAGWSLANISLKGDPGAPLRRALGEDLSHQAQYERLLRELRGAALVAWEDRQPEEPLRPTGNREKNLVRRVAELVEKAGNEDATRPGKLSHQTFGMADHEVEGRREEEPETPDPDLEEFELRETGRQQLEQLKAWIERAELSERERRVCELDLETDNDTKEIARRLGTTESTIRVQRKNYKAKVRKAAGI